MNLKGKGFVYISPDSGPGAYQGPDLLPNAWHLGNGYFLLQVLNHEMGHVFGLPHIGTDSLMSADYANDLINAKNYGGGAPKFPPSFSIDIRKDFFLPSFVNPAPSPVSCLTSDLSGYLDLPSNAMSLEYVNANSTKITVSPDQYSVAGIFNNDLLPLFAHPPYPY